MSKENKPISDEFEVQLVKIYDDGIIWLVNCNVATPNYIQGQQS